MGIPGWPGGDGSFTSFKRKPRRARFSLRQGNDREMLDTEIEQMKRALKRFNRGIIHPRSAKWIQHWDAFSFFFLFYTASVTPFEVCLISPVPLKDLTKTTDQFVLFILNRVVDCFFGTDMILNFFMAYQEPGSKGGMWITSPSKIRRNYIKSWFSLDLISSVPFDLITNAMQSGGKVSLLRMARIVRLIRLVKLLRILRASRIIARWQSFIGLSFAQVLSSPLAQRQLPIAHRPSPIAHCLLAP